MKSGQSFPLGATVYPDGVNFNIYSKSATAVDLLLFDAADDPRPSHVIPLDRQKNRTFHYWHAFLTGIKPGQIYAYRAHGINAPSRGLRFDADKILLDPYGKGIAMPARYDRDAAAKSRRQYPLCDEKCCR